MLMQPVSLALSLALLGGPASARVDLEPLHLYEFNRELARALGGRPGAGALVPAAIKAGRPFREAAAALRKVKDVVRLVGEEDSVCLLSTAGRVCWLPAFDTSARSRDRGIRFRGIDITFFPPEGADEKAFRSALARFLGEARGTRYFNDTPAASQATADDAGLADRLPPYLVKPIMATYQGWRWIAGAHDSRTGSPVRFRDAVERLLSREKGARAELACHPDGPVLKLRNPGGEFALQDLSPQAAHLFGEKDFIVHARGTERFRVRLRPARARVKCADAWTGKSRELCDLPLPREAFELEKCADDACATVVPASDAEKLSLAGADGQEKLLLEYAEDIVDVRVAAICCHFEQCRQAVDERMEKRR